MPNSSTMTEWSMTRSTGTSGLIFCGSPPSEAMRVAHGGEIDHGRNAGEVLHQHARRAIGDLDAGRALVGQPAGDRLDVVLGDGAAVLVAQQVFQQHLHRIGQLGNAGEAVLLGLDEAVIDIVVPPAVSVRRQLKLSSDLDTCDPSCLFCRRETDADGMQITRKGAGTAISAVRSQAPGRSRRRVRWFGANSVPVPTAGTDDPDIENFLE